MKSLGLLLPQNSEENLEQSILPGMSVGNFQESEYPGR